MIGIMIDTQNVIIVSPLSHEVSPSWNLLFDVVISDQMDRRNLCICLFEKLNLLFEI